MIQNTPQERRPTEEIADEIMRQMWPIQSSANYRPGKWAIDLIVNALDAERKEVEELRRVNKVAHELFASESDKFAASLADKDREIERLTQQVMTISPDEKYLAIQKLLSEKSAQVEVMVSALQMVEIYAVPPVDDISGTMMLHQVRKALAYKATKQHLTTMRLKEKVIEAARNLNFWCAASHGHIPGGADKLEQAFKELAAASKDREEGE